jgi:ketosteroid isomerase-like protein
VSTNTDRAATLADALRAGLARDRTRVAALATEDVTAWTPSVAASSLDELLDALDRADDAFSDHELDVTPLDVGGDHACIEWRVTMRHTGELPLLDGALLEPTGLEVTLHGVTVATFRGDRICSLRQYWDELSVYEQLGILGDPHAG